MLHEEVDNNVFCCCLLQVKIWFQNRRMKWKRSKKGTTEAKAKVVDKNKAHDSDKTKNSDPERNNNSNTNTNNNNTNNVQKTVKDSSPQKSTIDDSDCKENAPKSPTVTVTSALVEKVTSSTTTSSEPASQSHYRIDVAADLSCRDSKITGQIPLAASS